MDKELTNPPAEPVWWYVYRDKKPIFVKARLWFEAREAFGGFGEAHPELVTDPLLILELDENLAKKNAPKRPRRPREKKPAVRKK